uniref:Neuroglian n=1 Tax=Strigamia maritima TaxID=126957 RepID=T1J165_STRMM
MMNTPTIPCPFCVYLLVVFGVLHFVSAVSTVMFVFPVPSPPTISKHPILPPSDYLLFQIAVNQDEKEKPFALECEANGEPMPTYKWTKDGQPFQWQAYDSRIIQQIDRGTLVMMNLTDEDEGYYQCLAENEHGTALSNGVFVRKSEFNLFPDDKTQIKTEGEPLTGFSKARPYWVSQPNDTTAAENEDVEFECKAGGVPKPEINWFVHGVPLNEAPPNPRRKFISSTIIRIEKLQKSDTAVYQCNASSALGYVFSNFYINVLALPPIIVEPPKAKYEAVDSLSIILTCRVFGAPKPHVVWKMNGKELTGGRFNVLDSGDLEIHNVLFSDAGNYSCEANNSLGVALSDMDVGYLEVRERTRITTFPTDYIEVPAGQPATFRYHRMFKASDSSLTISKTGQLDSGVYTCVASTRLDNATASGTLIVQDIPNPPRMLGIRCDGSYANIKWLPQGDNRAPILNYKSQYNTSFTHDNWEDYYDRVPATDHSFSVSMSPWANYTFRVIARNKIGDSLASLHSEFCHTPPDVPYKNPENVVGKGTTPTNLVISWKAMQPIEHNGPEFIYRVYYRLDKPGLSWNKTIDISNWEQTSYEIINQEPFQPFRIKVEALNKIGQPYVAAVEVIGWSGEDSYKIEIWSTLEGEKPMREIVVPSESSSARVKLFVPFTMTNVRMRVLNSMHEGPPTPVISFQTPEGNGSGS